MTAALKQQRIVWCKEHGYPIPVLSTHASEAENKYDGLEECRKNVIRTNNSRKLQYCKA